VAAPIPELAPVINITFPQNAIAEKETINLYYFHFFEW
jgi:hypothetical protein